MMWWILVAVLILGVSYWFLVRPYKYWTDRGVKQGNPMIILGDSWKTILRQQSIADMIKMIYNVAPNERYSGFYQTISPALLLRDPDLIKQITVKDFDHFLDHRTFVPEDTDPLWGKNLFALTGKRWRDMRGTLSPAFTSSKMKYMFSIINESGGQFVKFFLKQKESIITIEMKDILTRFTNDVIANTAFGVQCDSLGDRDNEFYVMGKETTDFTTISKNIKLFGYFLAPRLYKIFNISLFSKDIRDFFNRLVKSNIESREKNGIVRPDMLHLLLEARKHGGIKQEKPEILDTGFATVKESEIGHSKNIKTEITDEDITAQAMIFFFGGFDSVSSLMCFMSHELAVNPEIQQRLTQEVDEALEACNGKITYEAVLHMKYMDMVVSETLRKWPNNVAVDRVCTKPYTIEPKYPHEKPLYIEQNLQVLIPIYGLHHDPQYYPDPDRFDPERFNDENKEKIKPYTYLPFGSGPRNCIGSRFALLETKILFYHILANFQIVPVEKTQIPLMTSKKQFNLNAEKGFWLGLKKRCKT